MTREEYIKALIRNQGVTLKQFACRIDMPYSTLLSMLNGSIGGAAVDSVIKICTALDIGIDQLQELSENGCTEGRMSLTELEKRLICKYRAMPEMQAAVLKLLEVARD